MITVTSPRFHDGAMEARVSALGADSREIKGILHRLERLLSKTDDRLRQVEIDTAAIKGRVSQSATAWQILMAVIGGQIACNCSTGCEHRLA